MLLTIYYIFWICGIVMFIEQNLGYRQYSLHWPYFSNTLIIALKWISYTEVTVALEDRRGNLVLESLILTLSLVNSQIVT